MSRPPTSPMASPTASCSRNCRPTSPTAWAVSAPAATRLVISAIPTGSLAPDSPSSTVLLRPAIAAPSEYREHHGRIGRRDRGGDQQREVPVEAEREVQQHRSAGRGEEGAEHAGQRDRYRGRAKAPHADVHAAGEQDADQRDGQDVLDRGRGERVQVRDQLDRDRRGDEDEHRHRHAQPLGDPVRQHGGQADERAQQDQQREVPGFVHGPRFRAADCALPTSLPGAPRVRRRAYGLGRSDAVQRLVAFCAGVRVGQDQGVSEQPPGTHRRRRRRATSAQGEPRTARVGAAEATRRPRWSSRSSTSRR